VPITKKELSQLHKSDGKRRLGSHLSLEVTGNTSKSYIRERQTVCTNQTGTSRRS